MLLSPVCGSETGSLPCQGARGEARAYLARLLQLGVGVGTATAAGFLLGRTALPALFTADDKVGRFRVDLPQAYQQMRWLPAPRPPPRVCGPAVCALVHARVAGAERCLCGRQAGGP